MIKTRKWYRFMTKILKIYPRFMTKILDYENQHYPAIKTIVRDSFGGASEPSAPAAGHGGAMEGKQPESVSQKTHPDSHGGWNGTGYADPVSRATTGRE